VANSADVVVKFLADTSQMERGTQTMGDSFKKLGRTLAGVFSAAAVVDFAKSSIDAAQEAARVTNVLERAYKGMGDANGKNAKAAEDYASQLSKQIAVDDETIMQAQTKLLLFDSLSTTAARTSGVFNEATRAAADLSARGLGDMGSSAVKLGKLLEDPIKNIGVLGRAGIQFTEEQKAHIAELISAGDLLGAQRFVLGEIEKKVGGAAAASATDADKAKVAFDEMQEQIGTALLPVVLTIAPAMTKMADAFAAAAPDIQIATVALAGFGAVALAIGGTVGLIVAAVALIGVGLYLMWTRWDEIWGWLVDHPAYAILASIILAPIAAMFLIIGALRFLWDNWRQIWDFIRQSAADAVNFVRDRWNDLVSFFGGIAGRIGGALSGIWNTLTQPFRDAKDTIASLFDDIRGIVSGAVGAIRNIWNPIARTLNSIHVDIPEVSLPFGLSVGGGSFDLPHVPELARGGIVSSPTLALIGEAGPEAVVPLSSMPDAGNVYQISISVAPGVSSAEVGAVVVDQIRAYERAAGRAWRTG